MSTRKTTTKHKHLQPVPDNQPIELANNPATWRKLNERIEKAVHAICQYDDQHTGECKDAIEQYLDRLNPARNRRAS